MTMKINSLIKFMLDNISEFKKTIHPEKLYDYVHELLNTSISE